MCPTSSAERRGVVLLVDVVGSSKIRDFAAGRDRRIRTLSKRHAGKDWTAADYTVTAWDEFQTLLWDGQWLPQVLLDIRQVFAPWEVYLGIGIGAVSGWRSRKPINEALSGEGFNRARRAMEELKAGKRDKYRKLTRFRTGDDEQDTLLNLVYGLNDTLVQQTTPRQWETIGAALRETSQEDVAEKLDIRPSTVTRNLKRGHYWQMRETLALVSRLMSAR